MKKTRQQTKLNIYSWVLFATLSFGLLLVTSACDDVSGINRPGRKNDPPLQIITKGAFVAETDKSSTHPLIRIKKNGNVISRHEMITLLANKNESDLRYILTASIATLPAPKGSNNSYMIHAPIINASMKDEDFYFVAISNSSTSGNPLFKNYLFHCQPQPLGAAQTTNYTNRFWKMFALDASLTNFETRTLHDTLPNLAYGSAVFKGGYSTAQDDEIMISPCPITANIADAANSALGHIYSFAQAFSDENNVQSRRYRESFWYAVGNAAQKMFDGTMVTDFAGNAASQLFLNTHGNIGYLHFRLENKPQHYTIKEITKENTSVSYYKKFFTQTR